jgi:hypothetical protein
MRQCVTDNISTFTSGPGHAFGRGARVPMLLPLNRSVGRRYNGAGWISHLWLYQLCNEHPCVSSLVLLCGDITNTIGTVLAILGVTALIVRYKGQRGRLFQVIWRDGGLQYITLIGTYFAMLRLPARRRVADLMGIILRIALRLAGAILYTPAITAVRRNQGLSLRTFQCLILQHEDFNSRRQCRLYVSLSVPCKRLLSLRSVPTECSACECLRLRWCRALLKSPTEQVTYLFRSSHSAS